MEILTSSLDHQLENVYPEFEATFGFGPCGVYAAMRRGDGWGDVAIAMASDGVTTFAHYIIIQDGSIIDLANPLDTELTYTEVEVLDSDEMPELVDAATIAWLREHIA